MPRMRKYLINIFAPSVGMGKESTDLYTLEFSSKMIQGYVKICANRGVLYSISLDQFSASDTATIIILAYCMKSNTRGVS